MLFQLFFRSINIIAAITLIICYCLCQCRLQRWVLWHCWCRRYCRYCRSCRRRWCRIQRVFVTVRRCRYDTCYICSGSCSLPAEYDLDCFQTLRIAGCSCCFAVLSPAHPSEGLCMYTIVDIIMVCKFTCKPDPDCFQTLRLSACSTHSSICYPIHPSIRLNMCLILNASTIARSLNIDTDTFETFALPGCTADRSIFRPGCFPAVGLSMYTVVDTWCLRCYILRNDLNLDFFQSLCFASSACQRSIVYPALVISICLNVYTVTDIIMVCKLSREPDLHGFQTFTLSGCTSWLTTCSPIRPSVCLSMYPVLNRSCVTCVILQINSD